MVEQPGRIRIVEDGQLAEPAFPGIGSEVKSGGEQGLLSVAVHPDYQVSLPGLTTFGEDEAGRLYLAPAGGTIYRLSP